MTTMIAFFIGVIAGCVFGFLMFDCTHRRPK